jgi:hypothetical protein
MTPNVCPPLLLLAGTSEAGKSTAGQHLASCGAARIKIRTILLGLHSGVETSHEGVATREGFDHSEFIEALTRTATTVRQPIAVIESFIDADLAHRTRASWPAPCRVVFLTAATSLRISRHSSATGTTSAESAALIAAKDARKHVVEQLATWRHHADHWIENDRPLEDLHITLEHVMASTLLTATTRSAQ